MLIVDRDEDLSDLVREVLTEEGYVVTCTAETDLERLSAAAAIVNPDCVLLDAGPADAGASWRTAAWFAHRSPSVPVIMFSASSADVREAQEGASDRAVLASYAEIVSKPFDLETLVEAVARATDAA